MRRGSQRIREIEAREGKPLREVLCDLYNGGLTLQAIGRRLGVSTSTVWYWIVRERLDLRRRLG